MDSTKINRELGWAPSCSLKEGLSETVNWYIENPQWISAIRNSQDYKEWMESNYKVRKNKE
ncbi:dTDP-glucose 4,6-dehydratase [subsurface metagenome]